MQTARKATPKAAKTEDRSPILSNGVNGRMNGYAHAGQLATANSEPSENIFLFYPNIIGMWLGVVPVNEALSF